MNGPGGTAYARRMVRRIVAVVGLAVLAASCSSTPTLGEYAEEVERLVLDMNVGLGRLQGERSSTPRTVETESMHWAARVQIRHDFLDAFEQLDPPPRAEDLHGRALDVVGRLAATEEAIAAEVEAADSFADLRDVMQGDTVAEFLAADDAAHDLCLAAQAEFDATEESAIAAGTPWIPVELREVVKVALACDAIGS